MKKNEVSRSVWFLASFYLTFTYTYGMAPFFGACVLVVLALISRPCHPPFITYCGAGAVVGFSIGSSSTLFLTLCRVSGAPKLYWTTFYAFVINCIIGHFVFRRLATPHDTR